MIYRWRIKYIYEIVTFVVGRFCVPVCATSSTWTGSGPVGDRISSTILFRLERIVHNPIQMHRNTTPPITGPMIIPILKFDADEMAGGTGDIEGAWVGVKVGEISTTCGEESALTPIKMTEK